MALQLEEACSGCRPESRNKEEKGGEKIPARGTRFSIQDGIQAHEDMYPEDPEWLLVLQWPRCSSQSGKFQPLPRQTLYQISDSSVPQPPPDMGCSLQGGHSYWFGSSVCVGHHFWEGGTQCFLSSHADLPSRLHKVGVTSKMITVSLLLPGIHLWKLHFHESWDGRLLYDCRSFQHQQTFGMTGILRGSDCCLTIVAVL